MERRPSIGRTRFVPAFIVLALIVAGGAALSAHAGWFAHVDLTLQERRQAASMRAPSDRFVIVDVDAPSVAELGPLPWPEETLNAAISLIAEARPDLLAVVGLDGSPGVARIIKKNGRTIANAEVDKTVSPLAIKHLDDSATLAGELAGKSTRSHGIDYGIDALAVQRVSFASLLEGKISPELFVGKAVVVAITTGQLRDTYAVPVHDHLSAAEIHILAAETALAGRDGSVKHVSAPLMLATLFVFVAVTLGVGRGSVVAGWLSTFVTVAFLEAAAVWSYQVDASSVPTAAPATLAVALACLWTAVRFVHARSEARAANLMAARSRTMFDRVVEDSVAGIVLLKSNGSIVTANSAARDMCLTNEMGDLRLPAFLHATVSDWLAGPDWRTRGVRGVVSQGDHSDAEFFEYSLSPIRESDAKGGAEGVAALTFSDVTARENEKQELAWHARHDPLTGLANRFAYTERLKEMLGAERPGYALLLDLDGFRFLNETNGHEIGDEVLMAVASLVLEEVDDARCIARLTRDQFAILIDRPSPDDTTALCRELLQRVSRPMAFGAITLEVTACVGVRPLERGREPTDVFTDLDLVLQEAKRGTNKVVIYDHVIANKQQRLREIELALPLAIENGEIEIALQPQLDLKGGGITGAEALVRWNSAALGQVSPDDFVPIAERTGHVVALGASVLERACREALTWPRDVRVAVNVSMRQIAQSDLTATVRTILLKTGLPPERLEIEVTESIAPDGVEAYSRTLVSLRRLGVRIALDDFGTGYSAIARLNERHFDKIKFDRALVRDIERNAGARTVLSALSDLSVELGVDTIVEGVENERQLAIVRATSCGAVQGYLVSRPLPPADFRDFARAFDGRDTQGYASIA